MNLTKSAHTLRFATNYNGKLNCQKFIHIDRAPSTGIPESRLHQEYLIHCKDGSAPAQLFKLVDLARIELGQLNKAITWQSHGMEADAFRNWYRLHNAGSYNKTMMAIFFYEKVE